MSSDSEASHPSAQRHGGHDVAKNGEHSHDASLDQNITSEDSATSNHGTEYAEDAEELESMENGTNNFTFARVRSRGVQQDEEETQSELSYRPRVERPGSPESTSTPDDTPSVQVSHQ